MKPNWTGVILVGLLLASGVALVVTGNEGGRELIAAALGLSVPMGVVQRRAAVKEES